MAKVSEVVTILKKQADLIGKLRSEKADLLAALRALSEAVTPWCEAIRRTSDGRLMPTERKMYDAAIQARAAIERAS